MFNCCSLYSGSSGNCFLIQSDKTNILIDAGVSCKKIVEALDSINCPINSISAILITHEHIDHTKSIGLISSKYNIPVYATQKTWKQLGVHTEKMSKENIQYFENESEFSIGDFKILPFKISHDAIDPCGFNILYKQKKISIATDIGKIDDKIISNLKNSCFLFLESNYESDLLQYSKYPKVLKQRIASDKGHLSNKNAGNLLKEIISPELKNVLLIHLSKENNFPELAFKTVTEQLIGINYIPNILVAPRNNPSQIFKIS